MSFPKALTVAFAVILAILCAKTTAAGTDTIDVPELSVPSCSGNTDRSYGAITYDRSMPDNNTFPLTQVDVCYDDTAIQVIFTAYNETSFYHDPSQKENDPIFNYEVMEVFVARGTADPETYLEFEVNPVNTTWHAFIYNPTKLKGSTQFYINNASSIGLTAATELDRPGQTWISRVSIPLGFFNVAEGQANGTEWRMNFFRTVTLADGTNQVLGAWSPTTEPNFHMTPFFGRVSFV